MSVLLYMVGLLVLLYVLLAVSQKQRDRQLLDDLKRAGSDPDLASAEMDRHIEMERRRAEEWKRQNPGSF